MVSANFNLWSWGHGWQDLVVNHYLLNTRCIESVGSWFQKIVLKLFPSKSMEAKDPDGLVNLEPRGMVGMIYVGDHQKLQYTKYKSCGPYGYGTEDLWALWLWNRRFLKFFQL